MKKLNECTNMLVNLADETPNKELSIILAEVVGYLTMVSIDLQGGEFLEIMTDKLLIPLRERIDNYILRINARRN